MNSQTEKLLSTGLTLVRDAGSAAVEKIADSKVGTSLMKAVPKAGKLASRVKNAVSVGAGLAIAKRGSKVALAAAKKNPVAVAAGAVVLAGPVTSYRVDQLRPLTHDAVTFLRAGGADLARAATAAEQALDAVGVSSPQPIRTATSATAPAHPNPAPPHMPGSLSRGTTADTGISR